MVAQFTATFLRQALDTIPLWRGNHVAVKQLVEDFARYPYLQRLRDGDGHCDERLSADLNKLDNVGPNMKVLTRGFYFAPGGTHRIDMQRDAAVTNSFPEPWLALPADERDFRVRVLLDAGWRPGTPFERADCEDVRDIAEKLETRWKEVFSEYHRVRKAYPESSEVQLTAQGKLQPFKEFPVSILREDGKEVTAVSISWARFTNDKIVGHFRKWVKANRPRQYSTEPR